MSSDGHISLHFLEKIFLESPFQNLAHTLVMSSVETGCSLAFPQTWQYTSTYMSFHGSSQNHRLGHHPFLPSCCKSCTYISNCYHFSQDDLKSQWPLWGSFDMNKIVHLTEALKQKEKNSHEENLHAVCLIMFNVQESLFHFYASGVNKH